MDALNSSCTHEAFAQLVGVSRQAVGDLVSRGVLVPGQTMGTWLLTYTAHLREHAAGRGVNGELAYQRSEESRVRREINEIKLAVAKREYMPVSVIELVLSSVGNTIASSLEVLPKTIHLMCPEVSPEVLNIVKAQVAKACDIAVTAAIDLIDVESESDIDTDSARQEATSRDGILEGDIEQNE